MEIERELGDERQLAMAKAQYAANLAPEFADEGRRLLNEAAAALSGLATSAEPRSRSESSDRSCCATATPSRRTDRIQTRDLRFVAGLVCITEQCPCSVPCTGDVVARIVRLNRSRRVSATPGTRQAQGGCVHPQHLVKTLQFTYAKGGSDVPGGVYYDLGSTKTSWAYEDHVLATASGPRLLGSNLCPGAQGRVRGRRHSGPAQRVRLRGHPQRCRPDRGPEVDLANRLTTGCPTNAPLWR
jgi:hypothetical protein